MGRTEASTPELFLASGNGAPHFTRAATCQSGKPHCSPLALIYGDSEGRCCQEQGWGQENFICLESDRKKEAWKFQRKLGSVPATAPLFVFAQLAPVSELRVR